MHWPNISQKENFHRNFLPLFQIFEAFRASIMEKFHMKSHIMRSPIMRTLIMKSTIMRSLVMRSRFMRSHIRRSTIMRSLIMKGPNMKSPKGDNYRKRGHFFCLPKYPRPLKEKNPLGIFQPFFSNFATVSMVFGYLFSTFFESIFLQFRPQTDLSVQLRFG